MGHLVGANKTLIDHFAGIGNMVVMKSQFVTSPDVIPVLTGNLLFPFDWNSKRNEFDTVKNAGRNSFMFSIFIV